MTAAVIEVNIWMIQRLEDVAGQQWTRRLSSMIVEGAYINKLMMSRACASIHHQVQMEHRNRQGVRILHRLHRQ